MRKKWWIIAAVILFIFVLLNPNMKQFKEYTGEQEGGVYKKHFKRTSNYLIFSIYEYQINGYTNSYLGVLSNFFQIKS